MSIISTPRWLEARNHVVKKVEVEENHSTTPLVVEDDSKVIGLSSTINDSTLLTTGDFDTLGELDNITLQGFNKFQQDNIKTIFTLEQNIEMSMGILDEITPSIVPEGIASINHVVYRDLTFSIMKASKMLVMKESPKVSKTKEEKEIPVREMVEEEIAVQPQQPLEEEKSPIILPSQEEIDPNLLEIERLRLEEEREEAIRLEQERLEQERLKAEMERIRLEREELERKRLEEESEVQRLLEENNNHISLPEYSEDLDEEDVESMRVYFKQKAGGSDE